MPKEQLRYDKMVEAALRGVVRSALKQVAEGGMPDDHHFYLTFRTNYRGVKIPGYLRSQYPGEMTIVLQYQYFGLEVTEEQVSVTLSFNNVHERLTIPFAAITTFADPSVSFALQFQPAAADRLPVADTVEELPPPAAPGHRTNTGGDEKRGQVVALDAFRKK